MTEATTRYSRALSEIAPDATSSAFVAEQGLEYRIMPAVTLAPATVTDLAEQPEAQADAITASEPVGKPQRSTDDWFSAVARGFLSPQPDETGLQAMYERTGDRRRVGIFDPSAPLAHLPVATYAGFATELTVPGGSAIPAFAITAVTVAATHRRRGLARAMMQGELRAAKAAGLPVASLTVSESSIYQRYGFFPAANVATWAIDRVRAGFNGPRGNGRVDYISREQFRELAPTLHERVRRTIPGEIIPTDSHWDSFAQTRPDAKEAAKVLAVQYVDADGVVQGLVVYSTGTNEDNYAATPLTISLMMTATDDAYAGLWSFFFDHDLIGTITAELRSADEPLRYMIADQRAARVTLVDHQYVRILDVAAVLSARTYGSAGRLVIDVTDPLDLDAGRFVLETAADGSGTVTRDSAEAPDLTLSILELAGLVMGGVSARTLVAAGRIQTTNEALVDSLFRTPTEPRLSFWY